MNVLFMTVGRMKNIEDHTLYCDLLRCFRDNGHNIYTISPYEKRTGKETEYEEINGAHMLHIKTGNVTDSKNLIEKGIATLSLESIFIQGIKKYFSDVRFDLVLYSTPPITFYKAIKYIKKRDNAKSYLLLKDIFPQNAVDIGMMTKTGPKSVIYKMFRKKEEKLYAVSDFIGCMSGANREYLIKHNPGLDESKIHINPNSIEVQEVVRDKEKIKEIKERYNIPQNAVTFIYGGNLGKPQGIPFLIECLKANAGKEDRFFVICGKGTEYPKLKAYMDAEKPSNVLLLNGLPKEEYEDFVKAFDIGLIFLDHRFTIPNFPSRLLSYMQSSMPVLSCTDPNTDVGQVVEEGGFGWKCESNSVEGFTEAVDKAIEANLAEMGAKGLSYLKENYTAKRGAEIISECMEK